MEHSKKSKKNCLKLVWIVIILVSIFNIHKAGKLSFEYGAKVAEHEAKIKQMAKEAATPAKDPNLVPVNNYFIPKEDYYK